MISSEGLGRPLSLRTWTAGFRRLRLLAARIRHPRAAFGRCTDVRQGLRLMMSPGAQVSFGERCVLDCHMTVEAHGVIRVGARTVFGHHVTLASHDLVEIGDDCLIAEMVSIRDHDHRFDDPSTPIRRQGAVSSPVRIGDDVWIGGKSTIVRGVVIGDHAVIGANSVVTADIPAWAVAVGSPARVIRYRPGGPARDTSQS